MWSLPIILSSESIIVARDFVRLMAVAVFYVFLLYPRPESATLSSCQVDLLNLCLHSDYSGSGNVLFTTLSIVMPMCKVNGCEEEQSSLSHLPMGKVRCMW